HHRRGDYRCVQAGISYGGGQKAPAKMRNGRTTVHGRVAARLLANPDIRRLAGQLAGYFALSAPRMFKYYVETLSDIVEQQPELTDAIPFDNAPWAAVTFNTDLEVWTKIHRDHLNLAAGWCAIYALGKFDHSKCGHLILHTFKLILEFPPRSGFLIPSASVSHSNSRVRRALGEWRSSITFYTAGGLFRFREYGFRTEKAFERQDPQGHRKMKQARDGRWAEAVSLFS
ncbi:hypothetical protein K488DRAFT_7606, partial [Vararia minispora EC-137]